VFNIAKTGLDTQESSSLYTFNALKWPVT